MLEYHPESSAQLAMGEAFGIDPPKQKVYAYPPGFSCPGVPLLPAISIFVNIFLFAKLHKEAWMRFVALSVISIGVYAFYGQYHADPENQHQTIIYHRTPTEEIQ